MIFDSKRKLSIKSEDNSQRKLPDSKEEIRQGIVSVYSACAQTRIHHKALLRPQGVKEGDQALSAKDRCAHVIESKSQWLWLVVGRNAVAAVAAP